MSIKLEKCEKCGSDTAICVFAGTISCYNCGQYIRPLTPDEYIEVVTNIYNIEKEEKSRKRRNLGYGFFFWRMFFPKWMRRLRMKYRVTLRQISKKTGILPSRLSDIEMMRSKPTKSEKIKILEVLYENLSVW